MKNINDSITREKALLGTVGRGVCPYVDKDARNQRKSMVRICRRVLPKIYEHLLPFGEGAALDVGCGNGRMNLILGPFFDQIFGIDIQVQPEDTYRYQHYTFQQVAFENFKTDVKLDFIHFGYVLYMCSDPVKQDAIISKINKLLNPGGIILIMDNPGEIKYIEKFRSAFKEILCEFDKKMDSNIMLLKKG